MSDTPTILIVDDEPQVCKSLEEILSEDNYSFISVYSGEDALSSFDPGEIDVVLLDINLPKMDGIQVLQKLKGSDPDIPVIMVTAQSDVRTIVKAMKLGAEDYIVKPFDDFARIRTTTHKAVELKAIKDENKYLKSCLDFRSRIRTVVGNSPIMQELYSMIEKVAPLSSTILLVGETGTGKELIAKAIHDFSNRADHQFLSVNCGGIPETLIESTLFGYEKGAFTGAYKRTKGIFEEADGGTLFLDEIGETSQALQVRLLRVLQDGSFTRVGGTDSIKVDVRLISATNKDLIEEVKNGTFREDLYYRLNVITLFVPPLSQRIDDIPLLVKFFTEKYSQQLGKKITGFDKESMNLMMKYNWPGNIRELENIVERAIALTDGSIISPNQLPDFLKSPEGESTQSFASMPFSEAKHNFEKNYIINILENSDWNVSQAARNSGIPRQNLYLKIKKYHLRRR